MAGNNIGGSVPIGDTSMEYIAFGEGSRNLVIIPGLSDGLATVKGKVSAFAKRFREFSGEYRVYVFSRKNRMEMGYSIADMAIDLADAMQKLGIEKADLMGVSQGGMISQHLAVSRPELINKLVLAVTAVKSNEVIRKDIEKWTGLLAEGKFREMMLDSARLSYTDRFLSKNKLALALLGRFGKPKDFSRFYIQANAILDHDLSGKLGALPFPVFVIGGDADGIVGPGAAEELAGEIGKCDLFIYHGLSHGLTEEAPDFNYRVLEYLIGDRT